MARLLANYSDSKKYLFIFTPIKYVTLMQRKLLLSSLFIICISAIGLAQPPSLTPPCWPPPCVPIDGGISLLIAAGAIYGGKKLYSNQKNKNNHS